MISQFFIYENINDTHNAKVRLPTTAARQVDARSPRFVINDVVTDRLPNLIEVGARKMISSLWEILVSRLYFCRKNRFSHSSSPTMDGQDSAVILVGNRSIPS